MKERRSSNLEKIFSTIIVSDLIGKAVDIKIRADQKEAVALSEAVAASRAFDEELRNPDATLRSVMTRLGEKHLAATNFETVVGVRWPL